MERHRTKKAFTAMYNLLNEIYSRRPYSNLACILGDLSPVVFADGHPADVAAWEDFLAHYASAQQMYENELYVAYYACVQYLRWFQEEFEYSLSYVLEEFTRDKYSEHYHSVSS